MILLSGFLKLQSVLYALVACVCLNILHYLQGYGIDSTS